MTSESGSVSQAIMKKPRTLTIRDLMIVENSGDRDDWGLIVDDILHVSSACMDSLLDMDTRNLAIQSLRAVDLDGDLVDIQTLLAPLK